MAQLAKEAWEVSKPAGSADFQGLLQVVEDNAPQLGHKVLSPGVYL